MNVKKNLVLLGMMGVGKSTLAKIAANRQKLKYIDIDTIIEKKYGMKIPQIFEKKGEAFFRKKEEDETLAALDEDKCIIALGGGAFINKTIREKILKNFLSIWLDLNLNTINKRIKWNKKRPLVIEKNSKKKINKLYSQRKSIYKLAMHRINCNNLSKEKIVKKILFIYENQ